MNRLKVPQVMACLGIQCQKAVSKEVLTFTLFAVKIRGGRPKGDVRDASLFINRHPRPVVGTPRIRPRVRILPGLVSLFARLRDGMEDPPPFACTCIKGADVPGRSVSSFTQAHAHDEYVFINDGCRISGHPMVVIRTIKVLPQINISAVSEGGN